MLIRIKNDSRMTKGLEKINEFKKFFNLESEIKDGYDPLKAHPILTKEVLIEKGLIKKTLSTRKSFISK
ncbi:MAG: hypothetical protein RBQ97_11935 [Acholeplasma sp.]|nr:hypothetical protein [Acholeplasma sp.]